MLIRLFYDAATQGGFGAFSMARLANRFAEVKWEIAADKNHLAGTSECLEEIKRELVTVLRRIRDTVSEARPMPEAA
jgi:hypothetical protein